MTDSPGGGSGDACGTRVPPGTRADLPAVVAELYTGESTRIPITVFHGVDPGPRVFVTAAVHGDELNGVAVCRELIAALDAVELRGTVVIVPIVNVLGAQLHSRYLPDRRDLNRHFPGSTTGSLASRIARLITDEVIAGSDVGVDLHTAANRRTNVPQVRVDTEQPRATELALVFGAPYVLYAAMRPGSLRLAASELDIPVLTYEGGEALRFDPEPIQVAVDGLRRLLAHLDMVDGAPPSPHEPVLMRESRWMRAERGGVLDLQVRPGQSVRDGEPLWTTNDPFGEERSTVESPVDATVIGATTLPLVVPGDAVVHLGVPGERPPAEDDPTDEEDLVADEPDP
jgi:uncharacterized protein